MGAISQKLTALAVKNAKPGKHFDGGGLYVEVTAKGGRRWYLKYRRPDGRENRLSLGAGLSLSDARTKADNARALIREGLDPAAVKAEQKTKAKREAEGIFPKVAEAWLAYDNKECQWAPETLRKAEYVVRQYLTPSLHNQPIATLDKATAKAVLANMPPSLARKARGYLCRIVDYAIDEKLRPEDAPLVLAAKKRGKAAHKEGGHIPAAVDLADVRRVVEAVESYPTPVTRAALRIAMLTAQRPGNVAAMEWAELDLDAAEWTLPPAKMKTRHAHIVPLSRQAVDTLRQMQAYTGGQQYVFPPLARQKTPHLHRDALSKALRDSGLQGVHATHGFRGMLRTVARERLGIASDVLEAQLAHAKKDEVQKAYDRTAFVSERHHVMQAWADYLDSLREAEAGKVVPFKRSA
ncbi:integrase [Lysobacteraceae bacterium NML75-0749]|nr:integrase [Xanthomonadaceae bacterium NML75-0749]PJK05071.1 integrase [Xanthomonadaceae bacterium NML71-0210]PJK05734.1 integrase [Xanthomonadaceae bacterium NML91-0268]